MFLRWQEKAFSMNVELVICDYARVDAESHIVKENANLNVHIEKELYLKKIFTTNYVYTIHGGA